LSKKTIQLFKLIILNAVALVVILALSVVLFVALFLLSGRLYRKLCCKAFEIFLYCLPFVKIIIHDGCISQSDKENLIVISNHLSYLDSMLVCGMGQGYFRNNDRSALITESLQEWRWVGSLMRMWLKKLGFVQVPDRNYADDPGSPKFIKACANAYFRISEKIRKGDTVLIMPEGRRNIKKDPDVFMPGAFVLSQRQKTKILPVYIHGVNKVLSVGSCLLRPGVIHLDFMPLISPDDYSDLSSAEYAAAVRQLFVAKQAEYDALVDSNEDIEVI
jgi:1-acyl-sn-glycerol-3-phosphate acyltransferase